MCDRQLVVVAVTVVVYDMCCRTVQHSGEPVVVYRVCRWELLSWWHNALQWLLARAVLVCCRVRQLQCVCRRSVRRKCQRHVLLHLLARSVHAGDRTIQLQHVSRGPVLTRQYH